MKRLAAAAPLLVALALIGAATFALDRYFALDAARSSLGEQMLQLERACQLARTHPQSLGTTANGAKTDLKALVQQSSARQGIVLTHLSETEHEAGEKVKERTISARAANVPHTAMVAFLADLESRGGGARVKEIRLKPAVDNGGMYQEAESVLAVRWVADDPKQK